MASNIVEFQNVSRVYKSGDHEQKALDGVTMKLCAGKFIVVLGVPAERARARFLTFSAVWTALRKVK